VKATTHHIADIVGAVPTARPRAGMFGIAIDASTSGAEAS
jgi:hypothetical protein